MRSYSLRFLLALKLVIRFSPKQDFPHHTWFMFHVLLPNGKNVNFFGLTEKENGPKTVKDVKIISAGKILENNKTVGECRSPLCDVPGGVTTMHVVVSQPPQEKGNYLVLHKRLGG